MKASGRCKGEHSCTLARALADERNSEDRLVTERKTARLNVAKRRKKKEQKREKKEKTPQDEEGGDSRNGLVGFPRGRAGKNSSSGRKFQADGLRHDSHTVPQSSS